MGRVECHSCGVQWEEPDESAELTRLREDLARVTRERDEARGHAKVLGAIADRFMRDDYEGPTPEQAKAIDYVKGLP